jgi:hypothetical protein
MDVGSHQVDVGVFFSSTAYIEQSCQLCIHMSSLCAKVAVLQVVMTRNLVDTYEHVKE